MVLIIDAGNTNIKYAVYDNDLLVNETVYQTNMEHSFIKEISDIVYKYEIEDVTLSSVVPSLSKDIKKALDTLSVRYLEITGHVRTNVILPDYIQDEIGADLVCLIEAAYKKNEGKEFIAISMGTATAVMHVDQNSTLRHCLIFPGLKSSARSLFVSAEQLNEVDLTKPKTCLALNTQEALKAGISYAFIGSVKHIINEIKRELNRDMKVFATGGIGNIVANDIEEIDDYDNELIYLGARILREKNKC